ncbi:MAG: hypothetical protein WAV51_00665 [Microgenomates group bacterium]
MKGKNFLYTLWKTNRRFWTELLPHAWNKTPLDGKLAWIMIITYTLCVLTLIEMLVLK